MNTNATPTPAPVIGAEQLELLEKLCNACAVSGDEGEVRAIITEQLKDVADEMRTDALGNLLVTKRGKGENRVRVMIAAHMDEVGFMIMEDNEGGIFRFDTVGGLDVRQLVGKPVLVGKDHLPGVIGAKPIHFCKREELEQTIPLETLKIDVGPDNAGKVKVGDRATFATRFTRIGPSLRAKALDNRYGVATLIELVKHAPDNVDLLAAFTVQEEVGLRGARVSGFSLDPDLAIAVDSTPANDLPAWDDSENISYNTRLGFGPAIYVMDSSTIADPRLVKFLATTAEANGIPYQFRQPGGGGTDAGAIHRQRAGIPSISVSVPGRYAHSAAGLARIEDWENTLRLLQAALSQLTPAVLQR